MTESKICTCPSGDGSLRWPCPKHPAVEQAGGDERDFQAKGAQEVPSPVSKEYDRHLIGLLRKGEALPGHQEEAADEIERLRDWNDHLNNTVLPNILNPNFLMLMKGGERLLDLCTKDGKFIGVSLNDMKDVFDWMVTHARIAPDHAALAQPSPASDLDPLNLAPHAEAFNEAPDEALRPEQAEAERPEVVGYRSKESGMVYEQDYGLKNPEALTTVAECDRIVGELRAENAKLIEALDESDGDRWRLRSERDAALARVAELEMLLRKLSANGLMQFSTVDEEMAVQAALGGAPVAQAQHSVPEGWMLVECGIWTQEQVDEMQKTVARFRNSEFVDDRALAMAVADAGQCKAPEISLAELLAAAPAQGGE
ncbi:TPA: hypothetical protein ACRNDL_001767 [Pseudomonas aeruginosa]